jgi:hypothetical protein
MLLARAALLTCALILLPDVVEARASDADPVLTTLQSRGDPWLIDEAARRLGEKYPDFDTGIYDHAQVRRTPTQIWVSFTTSIVLLRPGDRFLTARRIALVGGGSDASVERGPDVSPDTRTVPFVADEGTRAAIVFVVDAIARSAVVSLDRNGKLGAGWQMIIREEEDRYRVTVRTSAVNVRFDVSRDDGAIVGIVTRSSYL